MIWEFEIDGKKFELSVWVRFLFGDVSIQPGFGQEKEETEQEEDDL